MDLAIYLIGKTLVHDLPRVRLSGRIVETEAYPVGDMAGHAFRGETPSIRSLFLPHGHAYVYFTYGSCFMMNVSSEELGTGAGVLIRALEPLEGIEIMQQRRGTTRLHDLTRGPGRLAQAMDINKRNDGLNLCANGKLWLGERCGLQALSASASESASRAMFTARAGSMNAAALSSVV
jgi:DNA-3-methyladenine glycosylase